MRAIEAPEAPEAASPAAMTVTMKPFQRQALWRMQQEELAPLGPMRQFVHLDDDDLAVSDDEERYGCVLASNARICRVTPSSFSRGGWLCHQMGLGKTIMVIGIILSGPATTSASSVAAAPSAAATSASSVAASSSAAETSASSTAAAPSAGSATPSKVRSTDARIWR